MGLGVPELLIVLVVVLLLFGSTRIPKLARSIREAKRELEHDEPVVVVTHTAGEAPAAPVVSEVVVIDDDDPSTPRP